MTMLIIPYMKVGAFLIGGHVELNLEQLAKGLADSFWLTLVNFAGQFVYAAIGWLAVSVVAVPLMYLAALPLAGCLIGRFGNASSGARVVAVQTTESTV